MNTYWQKAIQTVRDEIENWMLEVSDDGVGWSPDTVHVLYKNDLCVRLNLPLDSMDNCVLLEWNEWYDDTADLVDCAIDRAKQAEIIDNLATRMEIDQQHLMSVSDAGVFYKVSRIVMDVVNEAIREIQSFPGRKEIPMSMTKHALARHLGIDIEAICNEYGPNVFNNEEIWSCEPGEWQDEFPYIYNQKLKMIGAIEDSWVWRELVDKVKKEQEEKKMDKISSCSDLVNSYYDHKWVNTPISVVPKPHRIWQNDGRHTTVEWWDGTKTTVCCEDPDKYTEWGGFCACVVKKLYGSATKAEEALTTAKENTAWPAKKKQIEREKMKEAKRQKIELKKHYHELRVQAKMEEMRISMEANQRMFIDGQTSNGVEENGGEQA